MFWPPWFALYICEMWQKMTDPVPDRVLHVSRAHYFHLSTQFCRDSYSWFTSYLHWMPWYPKHQESLQRQLACRIPHRNGAGNYGDLEPREQALVLAFLGCRKRLKSVPSFLSPSTTPQSSPYFPVTAQILRVLTCFAPVLDLCIHALVSYYHCRFWSLTLPNPFHSISRRLYVALDCGSEWGVCLDL